MSGSGSKWPEMTKNMTSTEVKKKNLKKVNENGLSFSHRISRY